MILRRVSHLPYKVLLNNEFRCMAVKTSPVLKEEIDYEQLCQKLQAQVTTMETQLAAQVALDWVFSVLMGKVC